jgi:F-type H+-transporting ATPase subunit b
MIAAGGSIIDLDVTFPILIGIFFVVLILLTTLIFNPLFAVIDERRKAVEGAIDESKVLKKDANAKKMEYDDRVATIKREAGDEREDMRQKARKAENEILEKGKKEAQERIVGARTAMASEVEQARRSLDGEARKLGELLADRILGQIVQGGKP